MLPLQLRECSMIVELTEFARRHWDKNFTGTRITSHTPEEFITTLNEALSRGPNVIRSISDPYVSDIKDGYADFCKLVIMSNFTNARTGTLPITLENYHYLRTGYHSRRGEELPVLARWFDLPLPAPTAKHLVVVVYSKAQLKKEWEAEQKRFSAEHSCAGERPEPLPFTMEAGYGIVAILGQMEADEEPMKPATMIRNALGVEEGGSGVPIDREKYLESVEFWKTHATVKS